MALITPQEIQADLAQLNAEAMGWLPLQTEEGEQGYLHVGNPLVLCRSLNNQEGLVIEVVGVADESMAHLNVLWLG